MDGGKNTVIAAAGDAARERGARADVIVKTLTAEFGGRGGGKPVLAQGGVPSSDVFPALLARAAAIVAEQLGLMDEPELLGEWLDRELRESAARTRCPHSWRAASELARRAHARCDDSDGGCCGA